MTAHAALTIAIQMDPIADIDITGDTSFALALEAQADPTKEINPR